MEESATQYVPANGDTNDQDIMEREYTTDTIVPLCKLTKEGDPDFELGPEVETECDRLLPPITSWVEYYTFLLRWIGHFRQRSALTIYHSGGIPGTTSDTPETARALGIDYLGRLLADQIPVGWVEAEFIAKWNPMIQRRYQQRLHLAVRHWMLIHEPELFTGVIEPVYPEPSATKMLIEELKRNLSTGGAKLGIYPQMDSEDSDVRVRMFFAYEQAAFTGTLDFLQRRLERMPRNPRVKDPNAGDLFEAPDPGGIGQYKYVPAPPDTVLLNALKHFRECDDDEREIKKTAHNESTVEEIECDDDEPIIP